MKRCSTCHTEKALADFPPRIIKGRVTLNARCAPCHRAACKIAKAKYRSTPEHLAIEARAQARFRKSPKGQAAAAERDWAEKMRRYRATPNGKAVTRRVTSASYRRTIDHHRARWMLIDAIKAGRIVRPDTCSRCGATGNVDAHHHHGYAREHALDVEWLCRKCHAGQHRLSKSAPGASLGA